jgi:hypothetical protein
VEWHLLGLGGTYVATRARPVQYDELHVEHDHGDEQIVVYKRAILLFTTDTEKRRRIRTVSMRAREPLDPVCIKPFVRSTRTATSLTSSTGYSTGNPCSSNSNAKSAGCSKPVLAVWLPTARGST